MASHSLKLDFGMCYMEEIQGINHQNIILKHPLFDPSLPTPTWSIPKGFFSRPPPFLWLFCPLQGTHSPLTWPFRSTAIPDPSPPPQFSHLDDPLSLSQVPFYLFVCSLPFSPGNSTGIIFPGGFNPQGLSNVI